MSDEQNKQNKEATNNGEQKGCGCGGYDGPMPQVTFSTFILSLSSSAMVQLGEVPDPESGQTMFNPAMAKHSIDVLAMLKAKTSKCLEPEEAKLLDGILFELRMVYVRKCG